MDHGVGTGDWRQHITNNNNNNIIRIIIKELGKKTRRKRKNEAGKRGLSSAASCGGFSGRERKKKGYISIYRQGRKGRWGLGFPHCPMSPPSPGLMARLSNALGNQVPIEVIWYLLTGPRRGHWWPRDHVVCCGERKGD